MISKDLSEIIERFQETVDTIDQFSFEKNENAKVFLQNGDRKSAILSLKMKQVSDALQAQIVFITEFLEKQSERINEYNSNSQKSDKIICLLCQNDVNNSNNILCSGCYQNLTNKKLFDQYKIIVNKEDSKYFDNFEMFLQGNIEDVIKECANNVSDETIEPDIYILGNEISTEEEENFHDDLLEDYDDNEEEVDTPIDTSNKNAVNDLNEVLAFV
ncbi:hypothetical protein TRFO_37949 [Tritrichomonas foetus]|uniref:Uncharacterized protein n=1 Tax=Tritrichomonas foetus TaxID=1144522 RepID=A0A1J4JFB6_9EUKA|nr:hypothetical protein TRFO_37949 [Tritrichomonas foetus]|eukprot:OHS95924.1 hypothetical protein TRFO_37949 [Tritrichomonas foetus]